MNKLMKWGLIGFIILIGIGALSSSQSGSPQKVGTNQESTNVTPSPAAKSNEVYKVGDKVNLKGKTLIVNAVKSYTNKNQFMTPKPGNRVLVVDVTLKNDSEEAFNYNVLEFSLQDNEDYTYKNSVSDVDPYLTVGAIQPGQTTRGFISFEIPSGNQPVKLIYTPSFLGTSQIIIDLL